MRVFVHPICARFDGHISRVKREKFNAQHFHRYAITDARQQRTAYLRDYNRGIMGNLRTDHYLFVRFEDLVAGEQSTASASKARALDSWNAALTFVGEAPLRSYAELERAFWAAGVTDTSPGTQCDALQGPDGVSAALRGTRFEALLTC